MKNKQDTKRKGSMKNRANAKTKKNEFVIRVSKSYHLDLLKAIYKDVRKYLTQEECVRFEDSIKAGSYDDYAQLDEDWGLQCINPFELDPARSRAKILLSSFLKKYDWPGDVQLRKKRAVQTFFEAENNCFRFNQSGWRELACGRDEWTVSFSTYFQSFIRKTIGDEPRITEMVPWMRHGPGSTTQTDGQKISNYYKYRDWPYEVTSRARNYAQYVIEHDERWLGALEDSYRQRYKIDKQLILDREVFWTRVFNITECSKITTVPKSAKTERTIAIEPTLNLYLQLGVDGFIRRRLKRWHIDLDCQAKNQELARRGSFKNQLVTIDLKGASDSISSKLIHNFFPRQWAILLEDLRTPFGWLDNHLVEFEKISSMGNGFTFALESLVFAACIYAANRASGLPSWDRQQIAVFGDDLIVPTSSFSSVKRGLELCGFTINTEKTFSQFSYTRESCGADWCRGLDFRPIFLRERATTIKMLLNDYNRLKRIMDLWFGLEEGATFATLEKWFPVNFGILGPLSDEEFDTYKHTKVKDFDKFKCSRFIITRIVNLAIPYKGRTSFFFRKMMSSLQSGKREQQKWERIKVNKGSTFDVVDRGLYRQVVVSTPHSDVWSEQYNPHKPSGPSMLGLSGFVPVN